MPEPPLPDPSIAGTAGKRNRKAGKEDAAICRLNNRQFVGKLYPDDCILLYIYLIYNNFIF
jgi:hypothetical protein